MKWILIICLSLHLVSGKHELYEGYVLYEVNPKNVDDIKVLNEVVNDLGLDVWSYANLVKAGEVFVSGTKRGDFENALNSAGIPHKATVQNIQELLEQEQQKLAAASAKARSTDGSHLSLDRIYTFDEVLKYLENIANLYPKVAKLVKGGRSIQGRPIQYLEISRQGLQNSRKPIIMIQSLLHAREWITLPPSLFAIHKLVVDLSEYDVLNNFDWIIMPVVNPDGYEHSRINARLWRKNRRVPPRGSCVGVDLNRNFDVNWGAASSSGICWDTFHGQAPNSEPETQAIVNVFNKYQGRIAMYIDLHSFGSLIVYAWGNGTLAPNALSLHVTGVQMAEAINNMKWHRKPDYKVGNIVAVINYAASGGASDYAQVMGIPFSYTYELPGYLGGNGFLVDPSFIRQAAMETWEGIVAGARHIARLL